MFKNIILRETSMNKICKLYCNIVYMCLSIHSIHSDSGLYYLM